MTAHDDHAKAPAPPGADAVTRRRPRDEFPGPSRRSVRPSWASLPVVTSEASARTRGTLLAAAVLFLCLAGAMSAAASAAAAPDTVIAEPVEPLSGAELETLVAPVALYPDDLLAIVLPASTFPLQVVLAARFLEERETDPAVAPDESWDASVVALLNYPEVVALLDRELNWTRQLGEAVLRQQEDVIGAVAEFRRQVAAVGNLESDDKQVVAVSDAGTIEITPVEREVIHVPYYDPAAVVTHQPERVYYYHPRAYPVYYYPYPGGHYFANGAFWGVTSAFSIGWRSRSLHWHHHGFHDHPYFGYAYHDPFYYRRPHVWLSFQRKDRLRRHDRRHHDDNRWRDNDRHRGSRPGRGRHQDQHGHRQDKHGRKDDRRHHHNKRGRQDDHNRSTASGGGRDRRVAAHRASGGGFRPSVGAPSGAMSAAIPRLSKSPSASQADRHRRRSPANGWNDPQTAPASLRQAIRQRAANPPPAPAPRPAAANPERRLGLEHRGATKPLRLLRRPPSSPAAPTQSPRAAVPLRKPESAQRFVGSPRPRAAVEPLRTTRAAAIGNPVRSIPPRARRVQGMQQRERPQGSARSAGAAPPPYAPPAAVPRFTSTSTVARSALDRPGLRVQSSQPRGTRHVARGPAAAGADRGAQRRPVRQRVPRRPDSIR